MDIIKKITDHISSDTVIRIQIVDHRKYSILIRVPHKYLYKCHQDYYLPARELRPVMDFLRKEELLLDFDDDRFIKFTEEDEASLIEDEERRYRVSNNPCPLKRITETLDKYSIGAEYFADIIVADKFFDIRIHDYIYSDDYPNITKTPVEYLSPTLELLKTYNLADVIVQSSSILDFTKCYNTGAIIVAESIIIDKVTSNDRFRCDKFYNPDGVRLSEVTFELRPVIGNNYYQIPYFKHKKNL
jgi:hypothetical protein